MINIIEELGPIHLTKFHVQSMTTDPIDQLVDFSIIQMPYPNRSTNFQSDSNKIDQMQSKLVKQFDTIHPNYQYCPIRGSISNRIGPIEFDLY